MVSMDELAALIGRPKPEQCRTNPADGYEIRHTRGKRGRVECVWVRLVPGDGFSPFRGPLLRGLRPEMSRAAVHRAWGAPSRSGASDDSGEWPWDRYDTDEVCIHLAYKQGGEGLRMITLMAPDVAPGGRA